MNVEKCKTHLEIQEIWDFLQPPLDAQLNLRVAFATCFIGLETQRGAAAQLMVGKWQNIDTINDIYIYIT